MKTVAQPSNAVCKPSPPGPDPYETANKWHLIGRTDSIAGIMNAAKGGAPPPPKKKKPAEEESDEESGTEEEEEDTSATNTDTEPEDEK